jgi:hypothetical protein
MVMNVMVVLTDRFQIPATHSFYSVLQVFPELQEDGGG